MAGRYKSVFFFFFNFLLFYNVNYKVFFFEMLFVLFKYIAVDFVLDFSPWPSLILHPDQYRVR